MLSSPFVFFIVRLREDVITLVLNSTSMIIPIGALVSRMSIDMGPNFRRRGHQNSRSDAGNATISFVYIGVPLVAIGTNDCLAVRPMCEATPPRASKMSKFEVKCSPPDDAPAEQEGEGWRGSSAKERAKDTHRVSQKMVDETR